MKPNYGLLAALYVSQYLGFSFFGVGLVAILRDRGASLDEIATLESLLLIWVAKPLWAPLVDRIGSYRRWLLVLQPLLAGVLLLATPLDPVRDLGLLMVVVGVVALLSATQDIATDAIAVRMLESEQRGIGNGVQTAGGYLGGVLGGGLTLVVYDQFGWAAAIVTLAVATVLPLPQILRFREPAARPVARRASLRAVFRRPGMLRWILLVLPPCVVGLHGSYALITPMLVDLGWSLTSVGITTNALGGFVGIFFGIAVGVLVSRFRRRSMLVWTQCAQVPAILLLAVAWFVSSSPAVLIAAMAVQAAMAATITIVFTVTMDLCAKESAATDFTVVSSFVMMVGIVGGIILTALAEPLGYTTTLAGAAAIALVGVVVALRYYQDSSPDAVAEPAVVRQV
ncbi:MFS transporter [Nocardia iowensis]|uniref:MFS transporter n=1 Tax=Nocardia iowensis TaxID=204891 RepID=A0ABX8RQW7_NOCIO|nr:MFS transporter [Nocardia iowensis]QXN90710.1 MFS transporter [Nocardia iowensis]